MKLTSKVALTLVIAALVGCNEEDTPTPDAGPGGGGIMAPADLPVLSWGTYVDPEQGEVDYASCAGDVGEPEPTGEDLVPVTAYLHDFADEERPIPNAKIWFFASNVATDTCGEGCQEITTSMVEGATKGTASVMARPGGWYAYRVFYRDGANTALTVMDSMQYNEPAGGEGSTLDMNSVSQQTIDLIPAVLGTDREPGTGLLSGRVYDCGDKDVAGAFVRAYRGDGTMIVEGPNNPDPHYDFFNGDSSPKAEQEWSETDGLFAVINAPISDGAVRVEAYGRPTDGDSEPVLLGCEAVEVLPDAVTIVNIGPLRNDYPAGHPCENVGE